MKMTSVKAFSSSVLALGILIFGAAIPAHAVGPGALTSVAATATGTVTTGAVAYPLTVSATTTTAGAEAFNITIPTGWTTSMVGGPSCAGATVTGMTITGSGCAVSSGVITIYQNTGTLAAGTAISVTFVANKFTAAAARDFQLSTTDSGGTVVFDTGTATLASASASPSASASASASATADSSLPNTGADGTGIALGGLGLILTGTIALAGIQVVRHRKARS